MEMSEPMPKLYPVLLSGGSGTRLWPISRESQPKQFLPLVGAGSLLQETVRRVTGPSFQAPLVVCNHEHRFVIAQQVQAIGVKPHDIILEPCARNTAAAIAAAGLRIAAEDPDGIMLVLPSDHVITDVEAFRSALAEALGAAKDGFLVTFGIEPTRPEEGYGYIRIGESLPGHGGVRRVAAFVEKPSRARAEEIVAGGDHLWNSGMFVFPVRVLLPELGRHAPEVIEAARRALEAATVDLDFCRLDPQAFGRAPNTSIDYALMERTERAAVVGVSMGWTDVGSWSALWGIAEKDRTGNCLIGDVVAEDVANCYVRSEGILTAVVGLDDVVVIVTDDAILVASKDKVDRIKNVVARLKEAGRPEAVAHRKVFRPWGFYQGLHDGERFQVKRLTVNPGAQLSLQKHYHRAEHWVVVNGTALVTRDGEKVLLRENESIYIPLGAVHRLENPGKVPLNLIEVQSGAYLGEDDIVRIEDSYGRN